MKFKYALPVKIKQEIQERKCCVPEKIQKDLKNCPESECGIGNHQNDTPVCASLTTELTYKLVIKKHWRIISYRDMNTDS